jgi:hypothetical protein
VAPVAAAQPSAPQRKPQGGGKDPLTTATLAELYVSQGFFERALSIYQELVNENPGNAELLGRLRGVQSKIAESEAVPPLPSESDILFDDAPAPSFDALVFDEPAPSPTAARPTVTATPSSHSSAEVVFQEETISARLVTTPQVPPSAASDEQAVVRLEKVLENIRRYRQ